MNQNTILIMISIVLALGILYISYLKYMSKERYRPVKPLRSEIRVFHIFPDYKKEYPLECKGKDILKYVVRGYTDETELREVEINSEEVVWKCTKGSGEIIKHRDYIKFITPELKENENEKLIFISAHYLGLTDATWIKIIK